MQERDGRMLAAAGHPGWSHREGLGGQLRCLDLSVGGEDPGSGPCSRCRCRMEGKLEEGRPGVQFGGPVGLCGGGGNKRDEGELNRRT